MTLLSAAFWALPEDKDLRPESPLQVRPGKEPTKGGDGAEPG